MILQKSNKRFGRSSKIIIQEKTQGTFAAIVAAIQFRVL